jgi:predicted transcriptional regulator
MTKLLDTAIATIRRLPEEDQDLAAEMLMIIADRANGVYALDDDEKDAVTRGLAEADRGEFASDDDVEAVLRKPWG